MRWMCHARKGAEQEVSQSSLTIASWLVYVTPERKKETRGGVNRSNKL